MTRNSNNPAQHNPPMRCSLCGKDAVYEARYSGEFLCASHFTESVERRIRKEIRDQIDFSSKGVRIAVAISGGKDSSVTLYSLARHFSGRKDVVISAFTINEGIRGYRDSGLESAINLARELGIAHEIVSFDEVFGTTMDSIVDKNPDIIPCSRCGPMRRQIMNTEGIRLNADYVALGINLDDYSQSILMNVARGDVDRFARMAPHRISKKGMVRRFLPLRRIPEKEVMLYAILKGIRFDSSWCPYYSRAQRNTFRDIVDILEEKSPGTKFAMLRFLDRVQPYLTSGNPDHEIGICSRCGKPSSSAICPICAADEN